MYPYHLRMGLHHGHDGSADRRAGTETDHERLLAASSALAASEQRFRLLAENASDIVYESGPDRLVTWVSPSITRALGWQPADLLGTYMSDLVHEDDIAWSAERRDRIYAGDPEAEAGGSFVLRLRATDGSYRWVSTTLTTHRDQDGTALTFTGGMKLIDEVMEERQRLADSEERLRLITENVSDVVQLMREGAIVWVSPSITAALGWQQEEWEGHKLEEFVHPDDVELVRQCRTLVETGASKIADLRLLHHDGKHHWAQINAGPYLDADGRVDGIVSSFRIVDEQMAERELLERRARYDFLTTALKREAALERIDALAVRHRAGDRATALLFIDVDEFKAINDRSGHLAGDTVLRAFVERVRKVVRESDSIARMGGDEFLVVLENVTGVEAAVAIADELRAVCAVPVPTLVGPVSATLSIGVALREPTESTLAVIGRADGAMYAAKAAGRNRTVVVGAS